MKSRRAEVALYYNDIDITTIISDYLVSFSYGDNGNGQADDIQITLEDHKQLWQGEWMPFKGDEVYAFIRTTNWNSEDTEEELNCGTFEVDALSYSGPPDTLQLKAISTPFTSGARDETKTRAWEKVTLSRIAKDIAKAAGYELLFEVADSDKYDRVDQTEQSDLAFLNDLVIKEGAALKVTDSQIVIFDEQEYENQPVITELKRGESRILSYGFETTSVDAVYVACQVSYQDPKSKKALTSTFRPPGAPEEGPVLKVNEQVDSVAAAQKLAKMRLREKNKEANKASFSLVGDIRLLAGVTLQLSGWMNFDGKYFVESAKHNVGGGYKTDIQMRKVLDY